MKKVFALIILSLFLVSCSKEEVYPEPVIDTSITDTDSTPTSQMRTKSSEIRISNVNDLKIFNNELYILVGGRAIGTSDYVVIYKYVDEKTPPIMLFEVKWPTYSDRRKILRSLEEYNGELYAGGELGIFKLDKQKNKFEEVEFSYEFGYVKDKEVKVLSIATISGKFYAVLNYVAEDPYSDLGISLAVLEGNTWKIVAKNIPGDVSSLKENSGEFYTDSNGLEKLHKYEGQQYWVHIPDKLEGYGDNVLLEKYNNMLYVCGEDNKIYSMNPSSIENYFATTDTDLSGILSDSVKEKLREMWVEKRSYENTCVFIKNTNNKLYFGFSAKEYADDYKPVSSDLLYLFDGKNWKSINFENAPGLSKGQFVDKVTSVEYFNSKLFIAVNVNYNNKFELQPSFYTLDDNGVLTPITWWKE